MIRLIVLFFLSGCAALIYATVWFYLVQLVVGASSISVAVILCAFMGGMAIGSWLLPRVSPRGWHPLRVVAVLEARIALLGIAIPLLLPADVAPIVKRPIAGVGPILTLVLKRDRP